LSAESIPTSGDLPGVVLARAIRRNIVAGALGSTFAMLVGGVFSTGFANALGLSNVQFGYMAAIPMLVFPARLLSSYIIERLGRRKNFFTFTAIGARLVWVAVIVLPFVLTSASAFRSTTFLLLLLLSNTLGVMAEPAWYSWMGDLIPEQLRARLWSKRYIYISLSTIVPTVVIALFKDGIGEGGQLSSEFTGFAVVFGFAVLCGVVDIIIHYGIPEPPMSRREPKAGIGVLEPLTDKKFRPFLLFRGVYAFSLALIGLFGMKYLLEVHEDTSYTIDLGFQAIRVGRFTVVAAMSSLSIITGIIGYSVWSTLIDRYGNKPILQVCTLMACFTPLPWLLLTRTQRFWPAIMMFMFSGLTFSGLNLSLTNLFFSLSPRQNRSAYVAINSTVVGLCGSVAPILTGYFMSAMEGRQVLGMKAFYALCIITSLTRVVSRMLLYRVKEGANVSTSFIFRRLTEANPLRIFPSIYALSAPATEERKVAAVSRLARSKLATRELVAHLDDPSPKVREEAVIALGKTRDPEAVDALIKKLDSPELELESARALGQIGDQRGVPPLLGKLEHPDPRVRTIAAAALGEIGDRRASEPLFNLLRQEKDEHIFSSYATALSNLGEVAAIWHILTVMRHTTSLLNRRQLAVAIGNLLGEYKVFYGYLDEECKVFGQRAGKIFSRCRRLLSRRQNNPLYLQRRDLLARIEAAEKAYLDKRWPECVLAIAAITEALLDAVLHKMWLAREVQMADPERPLDKFAKILMVLGRNEKLGTQLWYAAIMTPEEDPDFKNVTFEGCLLDVYALELIVEHLLGRRTARASLPNRGRSSSAPGASP